MKRCKILRSQTEALDSRPFCFPRYHPGLSENQNLITNLLESCKPIPLSCMLFMRILEKDKLKCKVLIKKMN